MNTAKLNRFRSCAPLFACPLCHTTMQLEGTSLICEHHHCFDIARQGYVNLDPGAKPSNFYSGASFEARGRILAAGYYNHIRAAVLDALESVPNVTQRTNRTILDAGCGEGFYARAVAADPQATVFAFDIAKSSILQAARADTTASVTWFVADLANIAMQSGAVDVILDIFSPANYAEFDRVLAPGGTVIKVVPSAQHVQELRQAAADQLAHGSEYSNTQVLQIFREHFPNATTTTVSATFTMPEQDVQAFAAMTPLFFNVDTSRIDLSAIRQVTVAADLLIGQR